MSFPVNVIPVGDIGFHRSRVAWGAPYRHSAWLLVIESRNSCSLLSKPLGPIRVVNGEFLESQRRYLKESFVFSTFQGLSYLS